MWYSIRGLSTWFFPADIETLWVLTPSRQYKIMRKQFFQSEVARQSLKKQFKSRWLPIEIRTLQCKSANRVFLLFFLSGFFPVITVSIFYHVHSKSTKNFENRGVDELQKRRKTRFNSDSKLKVWMGGSNVSYHLKLRSFISSHLDFTSFVS